MSTSRCFGVDLGGTKTEGTVLTDLSAPNTAPRVRKPTPQDEGYEAILANICAVVDETAKQAGTKPARLGIGTPGTLDPATQLLRGSNTVCLNGKPVKADLERMLGIPVVIENDANCFALAEATLGAAVGAKSVFGVILGTGVGGGIVIEGRTITGRQGIAGEWGHNARLEPDGVRCYCGRIGCVETVLSGPGLQRFYSEISGSEKTDLREIWRRAANMESAAITTLDRLIDYFGRAIASVINLLDPEVIVLGGGVSNTPELYTRGVESAKKHVFNLEPNICIVPNKLGDSAGVFGAAMLVAS